MTLTEIPAHVLSVLLHATGADRCANKPDFEVGWRNRYVCGPGHDGWESCLEAVALGLMGAEPDAEWVGSTEVMYRATKAGLNAARAWVADRQHRRVWRVVVDGNGRSYNDVVADTRSKARSMQVSSLQDAWGCTWREALGAIVSVRRHR